MSQVGLSSFHHSPLDCILGSDLKHKIYETKPANSDDLRNRIAQEAIFSRCASKISFDHIT